MPRYARWLALARAPAALRRLKRSLGGRTLLAAIEAADVRVMAEALGDGAVLDDALALARSGRVPARLAAAAAQLAAPAPALRLLDAARAGHPKSGRLRRDYLTALAPVDHAAFDSLARAILARSTDPADAHAIWIAAHAEGAALGDLRQVAADRFAVLAGEDAASWRLRARRDKALGEVDAAVAAYRRAIALAGPTRAALLAEAADYVERRGRYGSDTDLVREAVALGLRDPAKLRTKAFLALDVAADAPAGAFDHLVDRVLPGRTHYVPENRLLMIGNSLRCGGMERVLANSVAHLRNGGTFAAVDLALLDFDPAGESAFFLPATGLAAADIAVLAPLKEREPALATLPAGWAGRAQAVYDLIAVRRPRVVHIWNDQLGLIAGFAALLAGAPRVIVHFHHMRPTRNPAEARSAAAFPACFRRLVERPEMRFLFCSQAAADDYADWWQVAADDRFVTLHNGFEPIARRDRVAARAAFGIPAAVPVIGSLLRFEAVKQPLLWLDAAARIAADHPDARFLLAGDGDLLDRARDHAGAIGLGDRLILPGKVADIAGALAAMDLFMLTSASEGLPSGTIEAQLAGVPVVAFDVGGTAETVLEGVTARLVPVNDLAAIVGAANGWLADRIARAEAGRLAEVHALRRFSMERYLQDLEALYGSAEAAAHR